MDKLTETLQQIVKLALDALAESKKESERMRAEIRLLKGNFDMGRKPKLPPNVREFRKGRYQGRKTVQGVRITVYGQTPEETAERLKTAVSDETARQSAVKQTKDINPKKTTFGEFLQIWRETYKVPTVAASSLYQIDNVIKNHIPQWLKDLPLCQLTPLLIQRALNEVATDRMREYTYTEYSDCLGWAYDLGYTSDIMRTVNAFKAERDHGKAMTIAEQNIFLAKADSLTNESLRKLLHFYLLSGARPGEPLTMTAADFDYTNDRIHIPGTKNRYSNRFIPFFPQLHALLDDWLPLQSGRVFPFLVGYISKLVPKLMPGFTAKDLRHTFATRCKECGIPTDVFKQWLGHSKKSTVAESTYTHYDNVHAIEAPKFTLYPAGVPGVAKSVATDDTGENNEKPEI